jgi:hypothetical protein
LQLSLLIANGIKAYYNSDKHQSGQKDGGNILHERAFFFVTERENFMKRFTDNGASPQIKTHFWIIP